MWATLCPVPPAPSVHAAFGAFFLTPRLLPAEPPIALGSEGQTELVHGNGFPVVGPYAPANKETQHSANGTKEGGESPPTSTRTHQTAIGIPTDCNPSQYASDEPDTESCQTMVVCSYARLNGRN